MKRLITYSILVFSSLELIAQQQKQTQMNVDNSKRPKFPS